MNSNKRCSTCKQYFSEYYELNNFTILCANCLQTEKIKLQNQLTESEKLAQQTYMNYQVMQQQHQMRYDNISIQRKNLEAEIRTKTSNGEWNHYNDDPVDYNRPSNYQEVSALQTQMWNLKRYEDKRFLTAPRASYPDVTDIKKKLDLLKKAIFSTSISREQAKQRRIDEQRQRKIDKQRYLNEAEELLEKAKNQTLYKYQDEQLKRQYITIENLIQTKAYESLLEAIKLLKKEQDFPRNGDSLKACLFDYDIKRAEFDKKKDEYIQEAKSLFESTKKLITKDQTNQVNKVFNNIEELIRKETYTN